MSVPVLEELLAEPVDAARTRADSAWPAFAHGRPVVLYGAGGVGRRVVAALRDTGEPPVCFADRSAAAGVELDGIPVLDLATAARQYGRDAVWVVTMLNPRHAFTAVRASLQAERVTTVVSWIPLAWVHADALLPYYAVDRPEHVLEQADDVRAAAALLEDDASRDQYARQVAWRLTADFDVLGPPLPACEQYFTPGVVPPRDDERFVDCGAFDGDTLESFLGHRRGRFDRYLALEPDAANLAALRARVEGLAPDVRDRVEVLPYAAAAVPGTLRFAAGGGSSAGLSQTGEVEVPAIVLDDLLGDVVPTYVKMDIEGAEPAALAGTAATVARDRPVLALCAYHVQDHLWRLALALDALVDDYAYFLRRYENDCWEVVLYAVPRERLATL
ncbi:MAG: hypothetical protein QOH43_3516 [Solirubrobacteraceae bacterium]|nr:hypothetical protein [Solirubrobacteraceae bacterium]